MPSKKPTALQKNDLIRVVAPSSPFDRKALLDGVNILKGWGFDVRYQKDIFARKDYLAGDDKRRAHELIKALSDPKAKAILFARGGYGVMRLLPSLNRAMTLLSLKKPKIVLGCSDITPLLDYCRTRFGWPVFYGPSVAGGLVAKDAGQTRSALQNVLTSENYQCRGTACRALKVIHHGKATAPIVGGCLTLICATLGTPFEMNTDNKLLFLEDTGEKPYRIDRLLTQLKLAGKFKKCRGVIFGSTLSNGTLATDAKVIKDVLGEYKVPIVLNFPMGHKQPMITIPFGVKAELDTRKKTVRFLEAALK